MYLVSDEYKTQIKQTLRNPSDIKVLFDIENEYARNDATVSASSEHAISNASAILDGYFINDRIGTLEINRFLLDGESKLAQDNDPAIYQGYLSNLTSYLARNFATNPVVTVTFGTTYELNGISFLFDSFFYSYPDALTIVAYNGATPVLTINANPTSYEWTYEGDIPACDSIVLTATNMSIPSHKFRIENIIFGVVRQFGSDVITSANWKRDVDLINSKLPLYNFDFTFIDINHEFDPNNPSSLYDYLSERQRVRFYFGYELNDSTIEWVKGSEYFTTGENSIDSQSGISSVTVKSSSRLHFLTQDYTEGVYDTNPWSLHALLSSVVEFIGINPLYTDYSYISSDFEALSIQTTSPLPNKPVNQVLQIIANAGMCTMTVDRDGRIVIAPRSSLATDFSLTLADMMKPPLITKYPRLQGVDTAINMLSKETTASTIVSQSISVTTPTLFEFRYDGYTDVSVTSGALVITNEEIYDTLYRATINGTGTLTITGKRLITTERLYSYEYQDKGERCPIKNSLISTEAHALDFAKWVADYASCSNQYEIEDRGFPELDIDNINFDTLLSSNLYGTVFYSEISYNGTLSGKTKILLSRDLFTIIYNSCGSFYSGQELILPTH